MSHYTVLVAVPEGKTLDAVLMPYHEYECTGYKEYTEFVPADMTELQTDYAKYGEGRDFDVFVQEWKGLHKNDQGIYGRITNPNARWDWWTIGGRWNDLLPFKNGKFGNFGRAKDIDFETQRRENEINAGLHWRTWKKALRLADLTPEAYLALDLESKRSAWDTIRERFDNQFDLMDATFFKPKGKNELEHVEAVAWSALTFAFVDEQGKWNERGKMGWWACVTDEQPDYDRNFWKWIEQLDPETMLYVVDCHI